MICELCGEEILDNGYMAIRIGTDKYVHAECVEDALFELNDDLADTIMQALWTKRYLVDPATFYEEDDCDDPDEDRRNAETLARQNALAG